MAVYSGSREHVSSWKMVDSDDEIFGASSTAESACHFGDALDWSSCEDAPERVQQPSPMMMPAMPCAMGMQAMMPAMMPAGMAMPMPMSLAGQQPMTMGMPVGCPTPNGQPQMYMMCLTPDGQQMIVPVSSTPMPSPVPQACTPVARPTGVSLSALDARATALDAYASQTKVQARRATAAAAMAGRRGRGPSGTSSRRSDRIMEGPDFARNVGDSRGTFPASEGHEVPDHARTTLMFRNLPNNYNRSSLQQMLDSKGFQGTYSLIYLPTDFRTVAGFGYAFVNFVGHDEAQRAMHAFQAFCDWKVPSRKCCEVVWSGVVQGLRAHTERYRNSPVMHENVPDEFKPAIFVDGMRVPFPAPTKKLRPPRMR